MMNPHLNVAFVAGKFREASAHHQAGRLAQAEAGFRSVLMMAPKHFDSVLMLGVIAMQTGRAGDGMALFKQAVALNPGNPSGHFNLAMASEELGRPQEALDHYHKTLRLKPDHLGALNNRGQPLLQLGRYQEAVDNYDRLLSFQPNSVAALTNRSFALRALGRLAQALADCDRAIALQANCVEAHHNRGAVLQDLERLEEAAASFDRALAYRPDYLDALGGRAAVLRRLRRLDRALVDLDRLLSARPDHAQGHNERGLVLRELGRMEEALASFETAFALKPDFAEALNNLATACSELRRHEAAAAAYEKLLTLNKDYPYALGALRDSRVKICDWRGLRDLDGRILSAVRAGKPADLPFTFLNQTAGPADHRRCVETFMSREHPPAEPAWKGERYRHDRIRLAYVSADFQEHAVSQVLAGLFEAHDRERFDVIGVSIGPDVEDDMRRRLREAFGTFIDARQLSDQAVAALMREREIDIAVDLQGATTNSRPGIFVRRPAPVQVNYLGFPGTMGQGAHDYILADATVLPPEHEAFYAEKVMRLPVPYLVNTAKAPISPAPSRAQAGLPAEGFVFCCFNAVHKIAPSVFDVWMRLLARVEGSVLWLNAANSLAVANLRREAQARGVDGERLVFAPWMEARADHLARYRLADLFLDTAPYNAHATASDALWAGLPVLTVLGDAFAGRVGASLVGAAGLGELVMPDFAAYERKALELVSDPAGLAGLRARLQAGRDSVPPFDVDLYRRNLEAAFVEMHRLAS